MITIFSNPRPFLGQFNTIQRNAIKSWLLLKPNCEIILFNDEKNTTIKVAKDLGVQCITEIATNEFGTPLLSEEFAKVYKLANHEIIAQVNTDIILMSSFAHTVFQVNKLLKNKPFILVGRRWDMDITKQIIFNEVHWENKLLEKVLEEGTLHGFSGMDYWVFSRNCKFCPPPFAVGRPGIDNWLIYQAHLRNIPIIDATNSITIIHQNHSYPAKKNKFYKIELRKNTELAGGSSRMMTIRDADWIFYKNKLKRPSLIRITLSKLTSSYPLRLLISVRRNLINYIK